MSDGAPLLVERHDAIALITFNRPEKLNALDTPLLERLEGTIGEVEADAAIRAVVLTGAGPKAFVAGADIREYAGQTREAFAAYQRRSRAVFDRIDAFPGPVVAAVNGYALGGGFEIALCCDVIVASSNAAFGLPEGSLGLSPGGGGTQRLTRSVGRFVASDVLLSGRRLAADEARTLGLVADVVEPAALLDAALDKAGAMSRMAPLAAREMKRLVALALDAGIEDGLTAETEALLRLFDTRDAAEGIAAFVEKRRPTFEGS
jgi:enoyl-CoA hydratase